MKSRFTSIMVIAAMLVATMAFAAPAFAANLVTNGDFEAGNTGFTTDYVYVATASQSGGWYGLGSMDPEKRYAIGTNPFLYHKLWTSYFDHTSGDGTGNMMIVNATPSQPEQTVWQQTVTIPACDPVSSSPLYAGQDKLVGEVLMKVVDGQICVKFVLNDEAIAEGWLITETHVAVADTESGIPQTKTGNPIPGQFPAGGAIDPGVVETDWYCLDIGEGWTAPYAVAAHAVVTKTDTVVNAIAPYGAAEVIDTLQGLRYDYSAVKPVRSNADAVLTFTTGQNEANFYSLGFREDRDEFLPLDDAYVEVRFDTPILNGVGPDVRIIEDTWGLPYPTELAGVWAKAEAADPWAWLGFANNQNPWMSYHTITDLDLGPLASASYIKVQDMSLRADFASRYPSQAETLDGFDVNAIMSLQDNRTSTSYSETAWGGTCGFRGKNWATYICYTPKDCTPDYEFSFWAANSHPDNPAVLDVYVDDVKVGTAYLNTITPLTGTWKQFKFPFEATAGDSVIKIVDAFTIAQGDDFALDDISLVKVQ